MALENYALVFEDDFDGDTLDLSKWEYRSSGPRRCGFNSPAQVRVENGHLILRQEYRDGEYGPGWYAGMIRAKQRFLRGYFEIRCICSEALPGGFWSAFWIQANNPYTPEISRGGPGGAEIDVIEAFRGRDGTPGVEINIHVTGKQGSAARPGETDHLCVGQFPIPDCYTAFHTYGCEWTEEEYRFYIDGRFVGATNWGDGVSQVDEEVIVSLELPAEFNYAKDITSEFVVDYVRIYQKNA